MALSHLLASKLAQGVHCWPAASQPTPETCCPPPHPPGPCCSPWLSGIRSQELQRAGNDAAPPPSGARGHRGRCFWGGAVMPRPGGAHKVGHPLVCRSPARQHSGQPALPALPGHGAANLAMGVSPTPGATLGGYPNPSLGTSKPSPHPGPTAQICPGGHGAAWGRAKACSGGGQMGLPGGTAWPRCDTGCAWTRCWGAD